MTRFKIVASAVRRHFREAAGYLRHDAVSFSPCMKSIESISGFTHASITFETAMDMLHFLGVRRVQDLTKLMWKPYETVIGKHLRVLGGVQTVTDGERTSINLTVGYTCSEEGITAHAGSEGVRAECFRVADSAWDDENECFACHPVMRKVDAGYIKDDTITDTAFKITWQTEEARTQRQLGHEAVDREGVRRGTMEVQMPYYIAGPQLSSQLGALCDSEKLRNIVSNVVEG